MKKANRIFNFVTVALMLLCAAAIGAPQLTLPETVFDFGYAPQNATVSHKFWLVSTGDDTLKILKVVPG